MKEKNFNIKEISLIILLAVFTYTLFQNLNEIIHIFKFIFNLLLPFIFGCAIAFILNIPMVFIEDRISKFLSRKGNGKMYNMIRLLSMVISFAFIL